MLAKSNCDDKWDHFVNTNLFCFALLSSDHKILEFNDTAIQFLNHVKTVHGGQGPEEFIGKHVTEFYKAELAQEVTQLLKTGKLPFELHISAGEAQLIVKTYFYSTSETGEKVPCLMWRSVNKDMEREKKEREKTDNLVQVINSVQETVLKIEEQIEDLKNSFTEAGKNLSQFDQICSQTRILAINSAIEAARFDEDVASGVTVISSNMQGISNNIINSVSGIRNCIDTLHKPSTEVMSCCQELSNICKAVDLEGFSGSQQEKTKIVDLS